MGKRKGCGVMGVHFSSRLSETHPVKHPSIIPACECIKVMRNYPSNTLKGSAPLCQPPCKEPLQAGEMAWRWMEAQRSPRGPSQARLPPLGPVCLVTPTTGGSVPAPCLSFPVWCHQAAVPVSVPCPPSPLFPGKEPAVSAVPGWVAKFPKPRPLLQHPQPGCGTQGGPAVTKMVAQGWERPCGSAAEGLWLGAKVDVVLDAPRKGNKSIRISLSPGLPSVGTGRAYQGVPLAAGFGEPGLLPGALLWIL